MQFKQLLAQRTGELSFAQLPRGHHHQRQLINRMKAPEKAIATLAMDLRATVTEFIDHDLRGSKSQVLRKQVQESTSDRLKSRLAKASKVLDQSLESNCPDAVYAHAKALQLSVDNFRVYLLKNQFRSDGSKAEWRGLLYTSLAFKSELSDVLQNLLIDEESISQPMVENL